MNEEKTNNKESVTRIDSDLYAILKEEQIKHSDRYPRVSDIVNEAVSDWIRKKNSDSDTDTETEDKKALPFTVNHINKIGSD